MELYNAISFSGQFPDGHVPGAASTLTPCSLSIPSSRALASKISPSSSRLPSQSSSQLSYSSLQMFSASCAAPFGSFDSELWSQLAVVKILSRARIEGGRGDSCCAMIFAASRNRSTG